MALMVGLLLALAWPVQAELIDRGLFDADGIPGGPTVRLVYDSDLNITWLGDANFGAGSAFDDGNSPTDGRMTWDNAVSWADSLTVGGFTDWRLPTANPVCGIGFNCTSSEMGHLFYSDLGGTANNSILTSDDPDLALFANIRASDHWSGTTYAGFPYDAWYFNFFDGFQGKHDKSINGDYFAWAVRTGDVPVPAGPIPEPSSLPLDGIGFAADGVVCVAKEHNQPSLVQSQIHL